MRDSEGDERFLVYSRLMAERKSYDTLLEDRTVTQEAYSQLTQWVNQRLDAYQRSGLDGLKAFDFAAINHPSMLEIIPARLSPRKINRLLRRLTSEFEVLLSLKLALEEQRRLITLSSVREIYQVWIDRLHVKLAEFYEMYAHYTAAIQSIFISSAIHGTAQNQINELTKSLVISPAVAVKVREDMDRFYERARADSALMLRPSLAYLVGRLPFFREIPRELIRKIADSGKNHIYGPRKTVTREGDQAKSLFIVVAGLLEAQSSSLGSKKLLQGDYFGEEALLGRSTYKLNTQASVTTELLEIDITSLRSILHDYPQSLRHIQSLIEGNS